MSYVFAITLLDVTGKDLVKDICLYLLAGKLENNCEFCCKFIEKDELIIYLCLKSDCPRSYLLVHVFDLTLLDMKVKMNSNRVTSWYFLSLIIYRPFLYVA